MRTTPTLYSPGSLVYQDPSLRLVREGRLFGKDVLGGHSVRMVRGVSFGPRTWPHRRKTGKTESSAWLSLREKRKAGPYPHDLGFSDRLFVMFLSKLCAHGIGGFAHPHDRAQRTVCRQTEPGRHWKYFLNQRGSRHVTSWAS